MRSRIVLLFIVFSFMNLTSQDLIKAPKQYSFELGYRYMLSNDLLAAGGQNGYGFLIDYAWQLSGFTPEKHAVYLSVPLGYSYLPSRGLSPDQKMLHYGWAVRHILRKPKKVQPFLGYALLLNQFSIGDRSGQLFGHQTRFAFGASYNNEASIKPYVAIEYSMARHPQLDVEDSMWLHFVEFKTGIRIK